MNHIKSGISKFASLLLAVLLATSGVFTVPADAAGGVIGGSGSNGDPYVIEDAKDMKAFADSAFAAGESGIGLVVED